MASNATVCVNFDTKKNLFIVEDIETKKTVPMPTQLFFGILFKYEGDFKSAFLKAFKNKMHVIYSDEAKEKIEEIMNFNRIDC